MHSVGTECTLIVVISGLHPGSIALILGELLNWSIGFKLLCKPLPGLECSGEECGQGATKIRKMGAQSLYCREEIGPFPCMAVEGAMLWCC